MSCGLWDHGQSPHENDSLPVARYSRTVASARWNSFPLAT